MMSRKRLALPMEMKYFDTVQEQVVASAADWTGTEVPCISYLQSDGSTLGAYTDSALVPSASGSGYGQIQGTKYSIYGIRVSGEIIPTLVSDSADVQAGTSVRIVLVLDTQPNGAQAQGEEVFTDTGSAPHCNHAFLAMAAGSGDRFHVLRERLMMLQPGDSSSDGINTSSVVRTSGLFHFAYFFDTPLEVYIRSNSATPSVAQLSNANIFLLAHSGSGTQQIVSCTRVFYC